LLLCERATTLCAHFAVRWMRRYSVCICQHQPLFSIWRKVMVDKPQSVSKQLESILRRLEKLEGAIQRSPGDGHSSAGKGNRDKQAMSVGVCTLPQVPERTFGPEVSSYRESLIRYIGKKWVNGTKLK